MRQLDSFQRPDVSIVAAREECRGVFAGSVPRHDGGLIETRDEECAGSVTLVMFEKVKLEIAVAEVIANAARVPQHAEIAFANLRDTAIDAGLEHVARDDRRLQGLHGLVTQHPGLPVQTDVRDVGDTDARLVEAVLHRVIRKAAVMFASRETLLLSRSYDFTVLYDCCGRVAECG